MELLISRLLIFSTRRLVKDDNFLPNPADLKTPEKTHRQERQTEE